ncbi:MAG: polar amino acid transport system substrate-binding protein [Oleispira sp.]|jgi:polar amino acid transport system substrate-binding protein
MRFNTVFILLFTSSCFAAEPIAVSVGMYNFAPFVESKGSLGEVGMTLDLVAALNKAQQKYQFNTQLIPSKRRYQFFNEGHYDVIFYESKSWGWQDIKVDVSDVYQQGGEVYIALKKQGRDQKYFSDFNNKNMIGILGFHYGFANFNADEEYLIKEFNMMLTPYNDRNIKLLLKERGDVAVVTKAYLQSFLLVNPSVRSRLLISDNLDQLYNHTVLLRPGILPSLDEVNTMLNDLKKTGKMKKLLEKYGINQPIY